MQTPEGIVNLSTIHWTPFLKLLGFSADILKLLPLILSLFVLKSIFKNYQKGEIFSTANATQYRRLGWLFVLDALLIKSLSNTLLVVAVTLTNPPGHRYLTIQFGMPNMTALFWGILVIVISWVFIHGTPSTEVLSDLLGASNPSLEESMGMVYTPRFFDIAFPTSRSVHAVAEYIRNKRCIFYTGAGISAGVVPTMAQLKESLRFEEGNFFRPLRHALKNSSLCIEQMDKFYEACLYGEATPAHLAIRDIVQQKKWGLLTENLDLLHLRSGIDPIHHESSNWLKANVSEDDLRKIDCVMSVGLASDESGFLGWYKEVHLGGRIIAFNLEQPPYLGGEDWLILGNIQKLLPLLRERLF